MCQIRPRGALSTDMALQWLSLSSSSRSNRSRLNARSRINTLASRFIDRLNGSRLLEPTVLQSSSTNATLPCSGRSQYSKIFTPDLSR
ncbi:hypothetical protein D3C76_1515840 [compost metagenome]